MPRPPPKSKPLPSSSRSWSGLSACCHPSSSPHVIVLDDSIPLPLNVDVDEEGSAKLSARLLRGASHSAPSSPTRDALTRDVTSLLVSIGNRQEEHFRQMLMMQQELRKQVSGASRATIDANSAWQRRQEEFFEEFRQLLSTSQEGHVAQQIKMDQNGMKTNGQADVSERALQSGTGEFVDDVSLDPRKEAVGTSLENGEHCPVDPGLPILGDPDGAPFNGESEGNMSRASKNRHSGLHLCRTTTMDIGESLQSRVNRLLKSKEFELAVALAILTNAFIMCWECQYQGLDVGFHLKYPGRQVQADLIWPGADATFKGLDWTFGLLFLTEMLTKLGCWRCRYFYDPRNWDEQGSELVGCKRLCCRCLHGMQGWNLLDSCCVAAFLVSKLISVGAVNPQMLRLLRLVRLFRLVRLLRFMENLNHLYVMTTAIQGMSKVLTWAIVLLTIMLLTCNLFIVQILQATYFDRVDANDLTEDMLRKHWKMFEYFGTCTRCMLSMFEITLGNWPPVARLLSEEVSQWFGLFCVIHKLTIGFAVIGVITGVILQETFKVAQTDDLIMFRQKKNAARILRKKMKTLFESLDGEGDGKIHLEEFVTIGDDPEIKLWLASLDIETDDLTTLFKLIDEDKSGYITLDELCARMPRIKGAARSIDVLTLHRRFGITSPS